MDKKYLPSTQFIARLVILAITCGVVFGIYEITMYFKNRPKKNGATAVLVKDIVQKDSNNNGIPDWEESLWGLDPNQNGPANKEFITSKQKLLAQSNANRELGDSGTSAENELLAKQFFATIMSLQQSGNLTDASLESVVDTIGTQVKANPIPDIYTRTMIKTVPATADSIFTYKKAVKNLFIKYQDKNIGDELSFIAVALKDNDEKALEITGEVAVAYQSFAKELIRIPTPTTIVPTALALANSYEKTGQSISGLARIFTDPIIAMRALINYQKYNDELVNNLDVLSDF